MKKVAELLLFSFDSIQYLFQIYLWINTDKSRMYKVQTHLACVDRFHGDLAG